MSSPASSVSATPKGPLTKETFDTLTARLIASLKAAPKPLRLRLRARQDRANSGHRAGPRQVDRYDPRVRKRTRDIRGVEHARANDVRRKTGRAGDLVAPLDPVLGLPEDRRRRLGDAGHRIT